MFFACNFILPGDGNCLFHALSVCLEYTCNGTHHSLDLQDLMPRSAALRKMAVDYLVADPDRILYLEGEGESLETQPVQELLATVASSFQMTIEYYCSDMRRPSVWGGGPEIVALSNCLKRPIYVYELAVADQQFCLRRLARFGSPRYESKTPLHILSADSRFPDIEPGQHMLQGNHFLSLFPCDEQRARAQSDFRSSKPVRRRRSWLGNTASRVRGCVRVCLCLPARPRRANADKCLPIELKPAAAAAAQTVSAPHAAADADAAAAEAPEADTELLERERRALDTYRRLSGAHSDSAAPAA
jgi:OTU-like cysteine protease